jgi:hypothetical protein
MAAVIVLLIFAFSAGSNRREEIHADDTNSQCDEQDVTPAR